MDIKSLLGKKPKFKLTKAREKELDEFNAKHSPTVSLLSMIVLSQLEKDKDIVDKLSTLSSALLAFGATVALKKDDKNKK